MARTDLFFDDRFLDKHAGSVISDPAIAIVELVANSWDAYASRVEISWPDSETGELFSIVDDGVGMTAAEFEKRWRTIDYNRRQNQQPAQPLLVDGNPLPRRRTFGRNGRGRHAAFRFSDPYTVTTWKDGAEVTYEVSRGEQSPFDVKLIDRHDRVEGHGTAILATSVRGVGLTAEQARELIGTRFLADPNFVVAVNGTTVTFADVPTDLFREVDVEVPGYGVAHIVMLDTRRADRTTSQHGVAWRVVGRLVGNPSWAGFYDRRILDGRSNEAKRFTFIVIADFLEDAVREDWSGFDPNDSGWRAAEPIVNDKIVDLISSVDIEERSEAKATIRENLVREVRRLPPLGRDRWSAFVDTVVDSCPNISTNEIQQVAAILASLEASSSKYALVEKLHLFGATDFDALDQLLADWTVASAKVALDEIQGRLTLLQQLDQKLRDPTASEVGDLQPLFERSLWVFGPEFESIEFTSNRGMTAVIQGLFKSSETGSRLRPDFVALPDGSVGLYSRDFYGDDLEVAGVDRLVIVEIKKVGVPIGGAEKDQPWRYVKELTKKGLVTAGTRVTCFVLGNEIEPGEAEPRTEAGGQVTIYPMTYETFIRRAEKRMLGLNEKLKDAPFLKAAGLNANAFIAPLVQMQGELELTGSSN